MGLCTIFTEKNCFNGKSGMLTYFLLQIVFTNANSTNEPNIKAVQTINQTSVAFIYENLGRELPVFLVSVIKVSIVLVPVERRKFFLRNPPFYSKLP